MVYYAQGFHLALYEKPMFKELIIAWEHGPVVESLYHQYKDYGAGEIPQPDSVNLADFNPDQIELLDEAFDVYGQFSAWKLRNMTHSEKPWLETPKNSEIPQALMQSFFKTLLK